MAEAGVALIDAPKLVRAWNELALFVPAVDPGNAIVQLEEADLDHAAFGILDRAVLLPDLVVWVQKVLLEDFRIADRNGGRDRHSLLGLLVNGPSYRASVLGHDFGSIVDMLLVRCNKIPSTARNIFVHSRNRRLPVFSSPLWFVGLFLEPFPGLEDFLSRDEQIWRHPRENLVWS